MGGLVRPAHDGENAQRLCRVGGIVASHVEASAEAGAVVVVSFPENALLLVVEAAEIMLAVGIIVSGEGVECHPKLPLAPRTLASDDLQSCNGGLGGLPYRSE